MPWFKRRKKPEDVFRSRGEFGMVPRWSAPPKRNTEEWIKYFSQSPRLAVVERIASDLSFASGKLYRVDESGDEHEIGNHPFLRFWECPNPLYEMTGAALWRLFEIYLMLKGEGYFIIERDLLGRPAELWPVPVHWVQMTPYAGSPFYTVRVTSGQIMQVSVDDMFVMKDLNPFNPFERGLGQSESIADEIETDEYAAKFQKNFFFNDATSGTILSMPEASREQRERLEKEWDNEFKGVRNSHKLHILKSAAQVLKLTDNMKDMDMVQGRTFMRNAVLEHYGVPREIMGITESSNRATSEAAQFIYAQNVLMPKLRRREEAINRQLTPVFGENLVWHYDDIVPRNQEFDKAKALDGWNAGLLMRNEARELLDLPATENGDVFKTTFSDVYVQASQDPASVSTDMAMLQYGDPEEVGTDEIEIVAHSDALAPKNRTGASEYKEIRFRTAVKSLSRARQEQSNEFEAALNRYFAKQKQRIADALTGTQKADNNIWDLLNNMPEDKDEQEKAINTFLKSLLNWDSEEKMLEDLLSPLWEQSYQRGAQEAKNLYKWPMAPDLSGFARFFGAERIKIKDITETTRDSVRRIVSDSIERGTLSRDMIPDIVNQLNIGEGRARVIANQETATSLMTGQFDTMQQSGAKTKTWRTTGALNVRDSHRRLNGMTKPVNEPFPNGCMYPCDPRCSDPSEVVNCHCIVLFDEF